MLKQLYFNQLKEAFNKFDRSEEVDEAARNDFVGSVRKGEVPPLTSEEASILDEAKSYAVAGEGEQWKRIGASLNQPVEKFQKDTGGGSEIASAWGKAVVQIHASAETIFAWLLDLCGSERMKEHRKRNGDLPRTAKVIPGSRSQHNVIMKKFKNPVKNRLLALTHVWGTDDTDGRSTFIIAGLPRDFPLDGEEAREIKAQYGDFIVAKTHTLHMIMHTADNVCKYTYINQTDAGGRIPLFLMNRKISEALNLATRLYEKFERRGRDVDTEVGCLDGVLVAGRGTMVGKEDAGVFEMVAGLELTPPSPPLQRSVKHS